MKTKGIAIHGKMFAGKTTLKNALAKALEARGIPTETISFATPLKTAVEGIIKSLIEHGKVDAVTAARWTEALATPEWKRIFREELQFLGEHLRGYDEDIWARIAQNGVYDSDEEVVVLNDDLRHINEASHLKECDFLLVSLRASETLRRSRGPVRNENHHSETGLDGFLDWDLVIDQDASPGITVEDEVEQILALIEQREAASALRPS